MRKSFQWTLLLISFALFIFSLIHRRIDVDDAWIAEYTYWFAKLGYVKSEIMLGFAHAEQKLFIYHKLFIIQGALLTKFFGFNAYVLKSLSLLYFIPSCYFLVKIYRKYCGQLLVKADHSILLLALFISFHHIMESSFNYRPEMNLVFLGLLSFYLLDQFLDNNQKVISLWASSFFAGMAAANHLNGAIYIGAGVLVLWYYRQWWKGFFYGAIGSWGLFFYFFDVRSWAELHELQYQFHNWRDVVDEHYTGLDQILRILNEHQRYFHSPAEISYTVAIILLIFSARKYIFPQASRLLLYVGILSFLLASVAHNTTSKYIIYACPFFILLATLGFQMLIQNKKQAVALFAIFAFLITNWIFNFKAFSHKEGLQSIFQKIAVTIPNGSHVLAPIEYIFVGIEKQRIQAPVNYEDAEFRGDYKNLPQDFLNEVRKYDIDYMIMNSELLTKFNMTNSQYDEFVFDPARSIDGLSVFVRKK